MDWQKLHRSPRPLGLLPALIVVASVFHVLSGGLVFTAGNIAVLWHQVAINLVLAAGMTFVVLAGGIDLSVSSILAVSVVAGLLVSNVATLSPLWPIVSLVVGLGCGLGNGLLIYHLRLPPFVLTLASMTVLLGAARLITGDMTIYNTALPYELLGSGLVLGVPALAVVGMLVIIASWFVLSRTVLGVSVYAVGGNEAAARLAGISVSRIYLAAYGVSGLTAGNGAIMVASKLHGANAMQIGQAYTLDAITAVILGGTSFVGGIGSIWGTLFGALLIVVLSNGLILVGMSDTWQAIIKGAVIIGAVALDRARLAGAVRA